MNQMFHLLSENMIKQGKLIILLQLILLVVFTDFTYSQDVTYFWQLTDLHYDPWYKEFGVGSCNLNISEHGPYGDFECDSPWRLVRSSIDAMKLLDGDEQPSFVLLSGDHTPHAMKPDQLNEDWVIALTKNITDALLEVYPDTLVLPVLGNHDYWPKHSLPAQPNRIYDSFADMWSTWLADNDTQTTFRQAGYYSRSINTDHQIAAVALNNVLFYASNEATTNSTDPGNQFTWLEETLDGLRENDVKAFLFFHVPVGKIPEVLPGKGWLRHNQNSQLSDIVTAHSDIITASFSCHSHADSYKLFYSEDDAVSALFISPAVTPWRARLSSTDPDNNGPAHNPALRKVIYSTSSFQVIDIEQYYLDLEEANENETPEWKLAYTFSELYNIPDLSPTSLHELLNKMTEDESPEFESFLRMNTVNTDHPSIKPCNCSCKTSHLCGIQYVHYDDFDACYDGQGACPLDPGAAHVTKSNLRLVMCVVSMLFLIQFRYSFV